jgi:hypothetical protein
MKAGDVTDTLRKCLNRSRLCLSPSHSADAKDEWCGRLKLTGDVAVRAHDLPFDL